MMRILICLGILSWTFTFFSCRHAEQPPLFQLVENSGINFNNKVEDGQKENSFLFRNFYNGGGVAIGDLNNDGLPDVYFTSNMGEDKLYLNKGDLKFEDISAKAGIRQDGKWNTGVTFADINHDGWLDIYVCSSGHMGTGDRKNKLYINNHDLTFTESAASYGLDISAYTTQVSFFDYDLDGDLDCFMINNSPIPVNQLDFANRRDLPDKEWPVGEFLKGGGDHLFRNDNGHFTEVTKDAGIHGSLISFGLGVSVADINGDGYPDVFVSNDSYERDYLYINQKNGTFKDDMEQWMQHTSMSSMGADIADINNDGYPEIFTTDMLPDDDYRLRLIGGFDNIDLYNGKLKAGLYHQFVKNCLQLNNKNQTFSDIANYSGVSASDWSWGALMFDADNDGLNDIYVCNGVNKDVTNLDFLDFFANDVLQQMVLSGKKEGIDKILEKIPRNPLPNKMYWNKGSLRFEEMAKAWGMAQPSFSNGAAYGDLDNDGDMDLIVNNENQPAFVFRNNAREINRNNYIGFILKGKEPNGFAIGSKVWIYSNGSVQSRELFPSRGFQSSVDYKILAGLGSSATVDSVIVVWPDRHFIRILNPEINKVHTLTESAEGRMAMNFPDTSDIHPLLSIQKSAFDKHEEDDYIDFYNELNIPKMLSREGPKAAVGDVNGDGLTDIYIGGTVGHPGQIYLQTAQGQFQKSVQKGFDQYGDFEDGAAVFFDVDNDGDLDLAVGPSGNKMAPNSRQMQLRLYKNDGKGNFSIDDSAFPKAGMNVSAIAPNDFNGDGYADLFVGGRNISGNYGLTPSSYLLVNDGKGHFLDHTQAINPAISDLGMVTAASWADLNGDGLKELIIAGEWMSPRIFSFKSARAEEMTSNLSNKFGWWESLAVSDLNGDGRPDLIIGNIGENFYLQPDSANPVKLWVNDFDENGIIDKVLSRSIAGKDMPVFLKHDMEKQIPGLKKQNLKHGVFSKKTVQELFPAKTLEKTLVKIFNFSPSIIAMNQGNGQFNIIPMPYMVQLSSINAIYCKDVNGDGSVDLLMGGNEFGFLPQLGRLDASLGDLLINDGKGNFHYVDPGQSGLQLHGQVRDIKGISGKGEELVLFLQNDERPVLLKINKPN